MVLYSRADSWLGWGESRESDNVLRSLGRIFQISMHGLAADLPEPVWQQGQKSRKSQRLFPCARSAVIFLLAALLAGSAHRLQAQTRAMLHAADVPAPPVREPDAIWSATGPADKNAPFLPASIRDTFTLTDAGSPQIELHGIDSQPQHLLHAAADPRGAHRQDPHLLRVFSQPAAAAEPSQADHERHAVRHHPAHAGAVGRLRQQRCRGRVHHSPRTAGAQQHAHHRVHRPLHHGLRRPRQHHAVGPRPSQHLSGYSRRPAAAGRRSEAVAHAVPRSGRHSAAEHSRRLCLRAFATRPFRPRAWSPATSA